MMDGAFFKHYTLLFKIKSFHGHEVPLRQKEAYAPP
jgi:hypothetical protein